jgi:hypothetical protein
VHAFLGAGDVTLAQVLRLAPFTGARSAWGGQLVAAEVAAEHALAEGVTAARRPAGTLALTPFYAAAVDRALAREHDWRPIAVTLRDGLLAAVADDTSVQHHAATRPPVLKKRG